MPVGGASAEAEDRVGVPTISPTSSGALPGLGATGLGSGGILGRGGGTRGAFWKGVVGAVPPALSGTTERCMTVSPANGKTPGARGEGIGRSGLIAGTSGVISAGTDGGSLVSISRGGGLDTAKPANLSSVVPGVPAAARFSCFNSDCRLSTRRLSSSICLRPVMARAISHVPARSRGKIGISIFSNFTLPQYGAQL